MVKIVGGDNLSARIKEIAGDSYADRIARIEPLLPDCIFEAEAMLGADPQKFDLHMNEFLINFETDLVTKELIDSMQQLKTAEKEGNTDLVIELAKKCQVLSLRKSHIGKAAK